MVASGVTPGIELDPLRASVRWLLGCGAMTGLPCLREAAFLACATLLLVGWSGCEGALSIDSTSTERDPQRAPNINGTDSGGVSLFEDDAGGTRPAPVDAGRGNNGCTPDCSGRSCGDDGCGGSCGSCSSGEVCALATGRCESNAPQSDLCPPTGPTGSRTGDVVPDFDFPLDDGTRLSIRDLCHRRTVLIYWLAEWCGYCRDWMNSDADPLLRELEGSDFQLVILVGEDYRYNPASAADAPRIRSEYGFGPEVIVGWEDADQFRSFLGTNGPQTKLLMIEGNEIAARVGPLSDSEVRAVALR